CLHLDFPVVKNRRKKSAYLGGDIFHVLKRKFGNASEQNLFLVNVHQAPVSHDNNVKIKVKNRHEKDDYGQELEYPQCGDANVYDFGVKLNQGIGSERKLADN
ncbi:MAG: hypothetical protein K0S20_422, partial [Patescibacteria group bacterium]|nr:hypothetical protein [Patescibacteria group bacterium]